MDIETRQKKEKKQIRTIAVDGKMYNEFKSEMEKRNYSISEVLGEFMRRVIETIKSGGGEVVFGIHGPKWKAQDKKEEESKK